MKKTIALTVTLAALLAGCASQEEDQLTLALESVGTKSRTTGYPASNQSPTSTPLTGTTGAASLGTGTFISSYSPVSPSANSAAARDTFNINLVNAPVAAAAKTVLGDLLGHQFLVDPRVTGTVTLQADGPISEEEIFSIFESALAVNDAAIVQKGSRYEIVRSVDALSSAQVSAGTSFHADGPGTRVQVIPLKHIAASEMATILEPIVKKGAVLRADNSRNYLLVAGNSSDIEAVRQSIAVFDVDWMTGMSVAILPLKSTQPRDVIGELNSIFGVSEGSNSKSIKFLPNNKLNAILVLTSRPEYIQKAATWIRKLDGMAEANSDQMFVYQIQNRPAAEFAKVVQSALASGLAGGNASPAEAVAPDLVAETIGDGAQAAVAPAAAESVSKAPVVVADVENNALLISAMPQDYKRIERILRQLDILPTQVLLEATIAEVTLNDELKFGLRWYLEEGRSGFALSDLASGAVQASFPGFAWTRATQSSEVALSALSGVTKVKVISSPTLMVINNQKAVLQVGDQVPIVTQTSNSTSTDSVIVNSVELRDTGIILSVTPRINSTGRVMLDIQQEVSNVVPTTTSGIDSPTIQQRKISTRVIVNDGESLALGGLIQEKNSRSEKKMPVLGDIPLFGNAFKAKTDGINRTELVVFIRPKVVRDVQAARDVTDEFRAQFTMGANDTSANRIRRDIKRLAM